MSPARAPLLLALVVLALSLPGPAASITRLPGIRSPSGNISCLFVPGRPSVLLCKIARADYAKRLERYCGSPPIELDWVGFTLSATGKGSVTCSGGILYSPETQRPAYVTLPYGRTWRHGAFTCESRLSGVTCRSRAGHGLFLSRASWRGW